MFSAASLLRIVFTSILGTVAFDIGWYGIGNAWLLFGGIVALVLAVVGGLYAINRWQSTGYKRMSEKVRIPSATVTRVKAERAAPSSKPSHDSKTASGRPVSSVAARSKAS
jgi:hypothetical protein